MKKDLQRGNWSLHMSLTSSNPGSHHTNVDDRMFFPVGQDLDHGSDS